MKILLHSYYFWPSIGGIESVSHLLAVGWSEDGHQVTVVTNTPAAHERDVPYTVVRKPGWRAAAKLTQAHDVVYANGSSTHFFPFAVLWNKPFVWTHAGCALKWEYHQRWSSTPASLTDFVPSIYRLVQVLVRRVVAQFARANVAISRHMALLQPLARQRIIYNPFDYSNFAVKDLSEARLLLSQSRHSFSFLGRLVEEKGVDDLLQALALLNHRRLNEGKSPATLQVIGDGVHKDALLQLAVNLGIDNQVHWEGAKSGSELGTIVKQGGIFVVPSRYEEPMGLVALELMAAGKPIVVSERGGLKECAADACLSFPNGDPQALSCAMELLLENHDLQLDLIEKGLSRVLEFKSESATGAYLALFESLIRS